MSPLVSSVAQCHHLTHVDTDGKANMVGVGHKTPTRRTAIATGKIILGKSAFDLVQQNNIKKGDVLTIAHPLQLDNIEVRLELVPADLAIKVEAKVEVTGKTGVEMEALTSVSVSLLTIYDMCKAVTKSMTITDIKLIIKTGGKSDYCDQN